MAANYRIDSIRSLARKEAWHSSNDQPNYNPFARYGRQKRAGDEENLHTTRTADSVPSRVETSRLEQNANDYPHPHRAGTAPPDSTVNQSSNAPDRQIPDTITESDGSRHPSNEKTDDSSGLQNGDEDIKPMTSASNGVPSEEKHGLRQRVMGKFGRSQSSATIKSTQSDGKKKKKHPHIPIGHQIKTVVLGSWVNLMLIAVPVGFALRYVYGGTSISVFVVNFIAIIPLAATLSFATEELANYTGETLGGLLNASFGNATELIVSVIALAQGKIDIVQTSLIGSMLSNLLLVLGMCFFFGGITRVKQHFNITVAQTASSLLALAIGSLIIPTAFARFGSDLNNERAQQGVRPISYGTSIILLLVYASYLIFQLKTHTDMYNEPSQKGQKRASGKKEEGDVKSSLARMGAGQAGSAGGQVTKGDMMKNPADDEEEEHEDPSLSLIGALVTLSAATVLIAFCSDFMVTGIGAVAGKIPEEFIGLILIPIVGNAAEHATAVTVACKDKMDLAIGVAVGSSIQIALLVFPLVVVISWCGVGKDHPVLMSLNFDGFQVTVLFIAVLLVNYLIQDGESHWLEGVLLCSTYTIIAVAAFFYPVTADLAG